MTVLSLVSAPRLGSIHQITVPYKKETLRPRGPLSPTFKLTEDLSSRRVLPDSFLLLLLRAGEPLVQQLLAVVDLPGVDLHGDDDHQVHDGHGGEAKDEAVGFAVPVQLLCDGEHLHGAVDQRGHAEQPGADHGDDQVADVVARQRQEAKDCRDYAQEVGVLPLVGGGYHLMGHQAQLADCHLRGETTHSHHKLSRHTCQSKSCDFV